MFVCILCQSMLLIVPKLNDSVKNTQLLKCLAKCQMDEQVHVYTIHVHVYVHVLMRDEKEGRKKQARSNMYT